LAAVVRFDQKKGVFGAHVVSQRSELFRDHKGERKKLEIIGKHFLESFDAFLELNLVSE